MDRDIMNGTYDYDEPEWRHVSADAKNLIDSLLVVNQKRRFTAEQVCSIAVWK